MNTNIVINNISVELDVVGGVLFATSLQIAQVFEREHKSVIRSIENLPNDEFRRLNFVPSNQIRQNGLFDKETKFYKITRDGFSLLVMGFTGEKAYKWKIEFINAFNKMEAMIKTNKININAKFDEILSELSHKVALVNEFKQKYFESLERENALLRQMIKEQNSNYNKKLSQNEKENIIKLYQSGLSQAEICRQTNRSDSAVRNAIRSAL